MDSRFVGGPLDGSRGESHETDWDWPHRLIVESTVDGLYHTYERYEGEDFGEDNIAYVYVGFTKDDDP